MAQMLPCIRGGAAKADLFRAVVVWEYGGIYTDMDNAPVNFNASTTIAADDEAFFVLEQGRLLSQFFFAARPRHPLMFLVVQSTFVRLLMLNDVDRQYVPYVTGPGAVKMAFINYMGTQGKNEPHNANHYSQYHNPETEGIYRGLGNTTVTVRGDPKDPNYYIQRNGIKDKFSGYGQMNMSHFSTMEQTNSTDSCMNRIYMHLFANTTTDFAALLTNWKWFG